MQFFVILLNLVPKGFRLIVLIVLAAVGFILGMNGVTGDGALWQALVGVPLFALVAVFIAYIDKNHVQL